MELWCAFSSSVFKQEVIYNYGSSFSLIFFELYISLFSVYLQYRNNDQHNGYNLTVYSLKKKDMNGNDKSQ